MFGKDMNSIMRMLKQLQSEAEQLKKRLDEKEYPGSAGGGAVKVSVRGNGRIVSIEIDEGFFQEADPQTLSDMIIAAVNNALDKAEKDMSESLKGLGGLGGLF